MPVVLSGVGGYVLAVVLVRVVVPPLGYCSGLFGLLEKEGIPGHGEGCYV